MTDPLFCVIMVHIMKKVKSNPILQKVRSKTNSDIYYTFSNWKTKDIEDVTFIPVVKEIPTGEYQVVHYMRKENLEYVK